ncbi:MAG: hypothetical protein ABR600_02000 [Actinomycetota bacterium]
MPSIRIEVNGYRCARCGHEWVPRKAEHPRVCPRCKSPFWDRERRLATFRVQATLRGREDWPPDTRTLQTLRRQLAGLSRIRHGGRPPEVRVTGSTVHVEFNLQAQGEPTARSAAKTIVDGRARALDLRRAGYSSEIRVAKTTA